MSQSGAEWHDRQGCGLLLDGYCGVVVFLLCSFFKMLVIFYAVPVATPSEAVFGEKAIAEVVFADDGNWGIAEVLTIGAIWFPCGWLHFVGFQMQTGIVERIDVNSQSSRMFG